MLTEKKWTSIPSSTVDHIGNPLRTSIRTTLHVERVVFRWQAHQEVHKGTSICVLIGAMLKTR